MTIRQATASIGSVQWTALLVCSAACSPPNLAGVWTGSVEHDGSSVEVTLEIADNSIGNAAMGYFHPDDPWSRYDLSYSFGDLEADGYAALCGSGTCRWHESGGLMDLPDTADAHEVAADTVVLLGMTPDGVECFYDEVIGEFMPSPPLQFEGEIEEDVVSTTLEGLVGLDLEGCLGATPAETASFTRE